MNRISLNKDRRKLHNVIGCRIASFPGPTQLSVACSMEKQERAWYMYLYHMSDVRIQGSFNRAWAKGAQI